MIQKKLVLALSLALSLLLAKGAFAWNRSGLEEQATEQAVSHEAKASEKAQPEAVLEHLGRILTMLAPSNGITFDQRLFAQIREAKFIETTSNRREDVMVQVSPGLKAVVLVPEDLSPMDQFGALDIELAKDLLDDVFDAFEDANAEEFALSAN